MRLTLSPVHRASDDSAKQSKGRNGWFTPASAAVLHGPHDSIALEVWSKNTSGEPPVDVYFTAQDAFAVGDGLMRSSGIGQTLLLIVTEDAKGGNAEYALCTLQHFVTTNEECDETAAVSWLKPGQHVVFGGGAAPLVTVWRLAVNA